MSEQLPSETVATRIANELNRQLNFARSHAQAMRRSAGDHFQRGDIAKAYRTLGGAEETENMIAQLNSLRLSISDGDFDV